jgi:hypothetical protein
MRSSTTFEFAKSRFNDGQIVGNTEVTTSYDVWSGVKTAPPAYTSPATPSPPATVSAPVVVEVEAVVLDMFTLPVPLGVRVKSMFVSVPATLNTGEDPVAEPATVK